MDNSKVVLITGSSTGIGAATARLFAERGFKVAVTGSNQEKVNQVAEECTRLSPKNFKALGIVADLGDSENGKVVVRKTVDHYGKLDVLVNNVGIFITTHSADASSFDTYKRMMTINVDSIVKSSMEAVPHLERTGGNIVFVSSVASITAGGNCYAYRMSKAALSAYAKCLAVDVAPKIRVNIVSPGPVVTPLLDKAKISPSKTASTTLLGRNGECDEIAATIYYLASDEASFVNGAELFVDGGYLCKPPMTHE